MTASEKARKLVDTYGGAVDAANIYEASPEDVDRERTALLDYVARLEAVATIAQEIEHRATGKALPPTVGQWQRLTAALADLGMDALNAPVKP